MKLWGQPTKGRSGDRPDIGTREGSELDLLLAEETARRTRELLNSQGWCLWQCSALGDEVIAVVRDELVEVPEGYTTYTVAELEELCQDDVSAATLRLVHEAKRLAGATVIIERG